eukprot:jgi/Psemu1/250439/estExt_Genewise1Plus.C_170091
MDRQEIVYNPKKPKWWNQLGNNHRNATKSQKKAMRRVLDGAGPEESSNNNHNTTEVSQSPSTPNHRGIRLPAVPYGGTLDWDAVFPPDSSDETQQQKREIWLELGFGRGENLQALVETKQTHEEEQEATTTSKEHANNKKRFCLVGAEVSGVGIGCLCKRIDQQQQQPPPPNGTESTDSNDYVLYRPELNRYQSASCNDATSGTDDSAGEIEEDCRRRGSVSGSQKLRYYRDRLRIHAGDGYKLLPKLSSESLAAILITFPDPFPKDSDVNYRLVQQQTLVECHRLLRRTRALSDDETTTTTEPGRLFLATDHDGYHEWCHQRIAEFNNNNNNNNNDDDDDDDDTPYNGVAFRLVEPCPDRSEWLPAISRYEQKGWDEGRTTKLSCWTAV